MQNGLTPRTGTSQQNYKHREREIPAMLLLLRRPLTDRVSCCALEKILKLITAVRGAGNNERARIAKIGSQIGKQPLMCAFLSR